jgi:bacteriocin-like protein
MRTLTESELDQVSGGSQPATAGLGIGTSLSVGGTEGGLNGFSNYRDEAGGPANLFPQFGWFTAAGVQAD